MEKLTKMYIQMRSKLQDTKGATMVEYGLMVALIAAVCVTVVTAVGQDVLKAFTTVAAGMP